MVIGGLPTGQYYYRVLSSEPNPDVNGARLYMRSPIRTFAIASMYPGDFDDDCDVDQTDFGLFQACYSGAGIVQDLPECVPARLDTDEDVDATDFAFFPGCLSGPGVLVRPRLCGPVNHRLLCACRFRRRGHLRRAVRPGLVALQPNPHQQDGQIQLRIVLRVIIGVVSLDEFLVVSFLVVLFACLPRLPRAWSPRTCPSCRLHTSCPLSVSPLAGCVALLRYEVTRWMSSSVSVSWFLPFRISRLSCSSYSLMRSLGTTFAGMLGSTPQMTESSSLCRHRPSGR